LFGLKALHGIRGKGRAILGPFPLLFLMSILYIYIPEMQKKIDFFYNFKSDVAVSWLHQISAVPAFPHRGIRGPPQGQIPSNTTP